MSNVIGFNEFMGTTREQTSCWLCQKPIATQALFCSVCGSLQPPRPADHYARLGIERSLDVDIEALERKYASLSAKLSPDQFLQRGIGERSHAAKQLEVLCDAYHTLRDPLRRGRYWLEMNAKEAETDTESSALVIELRRELTDAEDPSHCDRIAQKAGQALEQGVKIFMQALRCENWQQAYQALNQLDGVEMILTEARTRRTGLTSVRE